MRDHSHQKAEAASEIPSADSDPHAGSWRRNKDITYPPEIDPQAKQKGRR